MDALSTHDPKSLCTVIGKLGMHLFFQQLCGIGGIFLLSQCYKQCGTELQCPYAAPRLYDYLGRWSS